MIATAKTTKAAGIAFRIASKTFDDAFEHHVKYSACNREAQLHTYEDLRDDYLSESDPDVRHYMFGLLNILYRGEEYYGHA